MSQREAPRTAEPPSDPSFGGALTEATPAIRRYGFILGGNAHETGSGYVIASFLGEGSESNAGSSGIIMFLKKGKDGLHVAVTGRHYPSQSVRRLSR